MIQKHFIKKDSNFFLQKIEIIHLCFSPIKILNEMTINHPKQSSAAASALNCSGSNVFV